MNNEKRFTLLLCMVFIIMGICGYQLFISFDRYTAAKDKLSEINVEQYHINSIEKTLDAVNDIEKTSNTEEPHDTTEYDRTNIFFDDGFKVKDSKVSLSFSDKIVSFMLNGTHSVNMDSSNPSMLIDGSIVVELSDETADLPDETCVISDNEENLFVIGKRNIDDNLSITLYYPTSEEAMTESTQKAQLILESAKAEDSMPLICFEDINLSSNYKELILENSSVQILIDENPVYFYRFNSKYTGAGFSEIAFNKAKLLTSGIKDTESGYSPYLLKVSDSMFEILAKSQSDIKMLFD